MSGDPLLNIASALIKQVLSLNDFDTWSELHQRYLPVEYHSLYSVVDKHCKKFHELPSFEDLRFEVRDSATSEKLYAIESIEVDTDPYVLLGYLKNEYAQKEILSHLEDYIDNSVAFEDAEESVSHLHQIVLDVEDKVELEIPKENMQRITLFEDDEEIAKYLPLGLNSDHDHEIKFSPRDLVLIGGKRGAGKSITCTNIANNVFNSGKTAIYFTIEMDSRSILQRCCAAATEVPFARLRTKNLNITEWRKVAEWWAYRFKNGEECLKDYIEHNDFDKFHYSLTTSCELLPTQRLEVIYDPSLTLSRIRAELDKKALALNTGVIIVDYINQVRRSSLPSRGGQYDWAEQVEVSKALKCFAQEYEITVVSPYQIDASGEARFAKGILDAADSAYILDPYTCEDKAIGFKCVKARASVMKDFISVMDWSTLKIGPESAEDPNNREDEEDLRTGELIQDI